MKRVTAQQSVLVVAGEASGDTHAAALTAELRRFLPDAHFFGIGGDRLAEEGQEQLYHISEMQVTGFVEVAGRYRFLRKALNRIVAETRKRRPVLILLVDYPGFNLRLGRALSELRIPICHYIAPQVLAWREGRTRYLQRYVDKLIVLFPFEQEFFGQRGIAAEYYGHPLVTRMFLEKARREEKAAGLIGDDPRPVIAYMPGSRQNEIVRHMPVLEGVADRFGDRYRHIIPLADSLSPGQRKDFLKRYSSFEICDDAESLLQASRVGIVKSGTSTLQAATIGTPFVVIYRASRISYLLARLLARVRFLSIVNILAGKQVVEEFLQDELTVEGLYDAVSTLLADDERREHVKREFHSITHALEGDAPYRKAAGSIAQMVLNSIA